MPDTLFYLIAGYAAYCLIVGGYALYVWRHRA